MTRFVRAPAALCRMNGVSDSARFLWVVLKSFADADGGSCFPGVAKLAEMCGRNRKAIFRYITELEDAGLLARSSGRKGGEWATNSYRLFDAPPCPLFGTSPCPQNGDTTKNHVPKRAPKRAKWDGLGGAHRDGRRTLPRVEE